MAQVDDLRSWRVSGTVCPTVPSFSALRARAHIPQWGGELEGIKGPKGQRDAALDLGERTLAKKWKCAHFSQRA